MHDAARKCIQSKGRLIDISQKLPNGHQQRCASTPTFETGRFARLAQATDLLSRVFRAIQGQSASTEDDLESVAQLERTLFALEHLASSEEQERRICNLSSMATCYRYANPSPF